MKLMIEGRWRGDVATATTDWSHPIETGTFRGFVSADGVSGFPAAVGRYHLYASYACPFAHRAILGRALKGLEHVVGLSILHPTWNTPDGWTFGETPFSTLDGGGAGFRHLHEAYSTAQPNYTGKITVPVLWDTRARTIVSNESLDILLMFNDAFDGIGGDATVDLYPKALQSEIDELNARIAGDLARRVYAVGSAANQEHYDRENVTLFAFLDEMEQRLSDGRPFLNGSLLTVSDILAFTPLVRFDAVYNPLFRASLKRLIDYEHLSAFVDRIYRLPGVADTVRFDHIMMHYHDGDWGVATRRGIVPALPQVDFRSRLRAHRAAA